MTWLSLLINANGLPVYSFRLFQVLIMEMKIMVLLFLYFNSYMFCFFFLPCGTKISSTILTKTGNNGHPCLISCLREKAFGILPFCVMTSVDILYIPSISLIFLLLLISKNFIINVKCFIIYFFHIYWEDHVIIVFILLKQ